MKTPPRIPQPAQSPPQAQDKQGKPIRVKPLNTVKPKRKHTKQKALLKRLPEILKGKSIRELATEVGYTEGSRNMYRGHIKSQVKAIYKIDDQEVIRRFDLIFDMAMKRKELANASRSNEALARINGQFKDNNHTNIIVVNKTEGDILHKYSNGKGLRQEGNKIEEGRGTPPTVTP